MTITWLRKEAVIAMHRELLKEHGGLAGIVDEECLESTLARPLHQVDYAGELAGLAQLAAAYGFGLSRNHCFSDGNKRISLTAIDVFLQLNGHELVASELEAVAAMRELAAGDMDESGLADWVGENMEKLSDGN